MAMGSNTEAVSSAVDIVVASIRNQIASRERSPGERIVEAELARTFGVSRGPIREALQHLAAVGLLEEHPRRGWAVRSMSRNDVRELYEVREALEGQAAALTATRSGDPAVTARLTELRAWLVGFTENLPRYVEDLQQRDRFHDELGALADNKLLTTLLTQMRPLIVQLQFRGFIFATRPAEALAEHLEICDALLAGDAALADALTRAHIRTSRDVLLALPPSVFA